jgi:hypothetical protein
MTSFRRNGGTINYSTHGRLWLSTLAGRRSQTEIVLRSVIAVQLKFQLRRVYYIASSIYLPGLSTLRCSTINRVSIKHAITQNAV